MYFLGEITLSSLGKRRKKVSSLTADVKALEKVLPIADYASPAYDCEFYGEPYTAVLKNHYLRRPSIMDYLTREAAMLKGFESEMNVLCSIRNRSHQDLAFSVCSIVRRVRVFGFVFEHNQHLLFDVINSNEFKWDSTFSSIERSLAHLN